MAIRNYSTPDGLLLINGTPINDWGATDPAMTIEDMKPRTRFKHGLGGNTAALDPVTIPKRLTVNLLPGSAQARFLVGLTKARTTIQSSWTQMGSEEIEVLVDGRVMSRGPRGRISENESSLSDEQFVLEFRDSSET